MKNLGTLFSCALLLVSLVSCIPSTRPISEKNETTDARLAGIWFLDDTKFDVRLDGDVYLIKQTGKDREVDYRMTLSKIGNDVFASIGPGLDTQALDKKYGGFVLPIYRLYRLDISDTEIKLLWANGENDKKIPVEGIKVLQDEGKADFLIIEENESKMKEWLTKNRDCFKGELVYRREGKKDGKTEAK